MKVTIDVRTLLHKLESLNPGINLDGVKAYLFDLTLGASDSETPSTPTYIPPMAGNYQVSAHHQVSSHVQEYPEIEMESNPPVAPTPANKPKRVIVSSSGGSSNQNVSAKISREEKLARRAEAQRLADIPSKELLKQLTTQNEAKRDGNQFTSEGVDYSSGNGGDLEIG